MVFYNRRFNPQTVSGVVKEIVHLVKTYSLDEIALVDSNFLVDTRRATALARGFVESGVHFRWTFQASTDLLCRLSDEEVALLATSGVSHIGFGTESGSPEILQKMHKAHQKIEDMFEAARKCRDAGIRVTYNLIFGYPGEEDRHRRETLRVMGEIAEQFENVTFSPNLFTPYPGIPIWPELIESGLREPQSFEEWAAVGLGQAELPWLSDRASSELARGMSYFMLANQLSKITSQSRSGLRPQRNAAFAEAPALAFETSRLRLAGGALGFDGTALAGSAPLIADRRPFGTTDERGSVNRLGRHMDVLLTHSNDVFSDEKQRRKMEPYPPLQTLLAAAVLREPALLSTFAISLSTLQKRL